MSSLDAEDQAILESVENGEWQSVPNVAQEIQRYQQYAQSQVDALEEVRIELSVSDMRSLQTLAQQSGVSVTLLAASVIHQYVANQASPQNIPPQRTIIISERQRVQIERRLERRRRDARGSSSKARRPRDP